MNDRPSYGILAGLARNQPLNPNLYPSYGSRSALSGTLADLLFATRKRRKEKYAPSNKSKKEFDPEGAGYDHVTADRLRKKYPLTMPKPVGAPLDGESWERNNKGAFEAWVWHPEEKDWAIHGSSRDPESGMMLKGRKYSTWDKTVAGEKAAGYEIYKGKNGRYYSRKKKTK